MFTSMTRTLRNTEISHMQVHGISNVFMVRHEPSEAYTPCFESGNGGEHAMRVHTKCHLHYHPHVELSTRS